MAASRVVNYTFASYRLHNCTMMIYCIWLCLFRIPGLLSSIYLSSFASYITRHKGHIDWSRHCPESALGHSFQLALAAPALYLPQDAQGRGGWLISSACVPGVPARNIAPIPLVHAGKERREHLKRTKAPASHLPGTEAPGVSTWSITALALKRKERRIMHRSGDMA